MRLHHSNTLRLKVKMSLTVRILKSLQQQVSVLSCNVQLSCLALPVRLVNLYTKATRSGEVLSFPMMGSRHYGEVVNVRSQECWFWT